MLKKLFLYCLISVALLVVFVTTASFNESSGRAQSIASANSNSPSKQSQNLPGKIQQVIPKQLPLTLVSTAPISGATNVALSPTIVLQFSQSIAPNSPMPWLSPSIPGTWSVTTPDGLTFTPQGEFTPFTQVSINLPGGPGGIMSDNSQYLSQNQVITFTTQPGSVIQLQEDLAELGYLPLSYTATTNTFAWQYQNVPAGLQALWQPGVFTEMTKAAVMSFEYYNGLSIDGIAGQQVWTALQSDLASNKTNPFGYSYVMVTKNQPETVQVWHNGQVAFSTLANTGIAAAPTPDGTFAIYLRYTSTTMKGVNPNGTHYDDPNIPWVSYFNGGDALHGFIRASYGFPQSVGCVEMPFSSAQTVFNLTTFGTLVNIS